MRSYSRVLILGYSCPNVMTRGRESVLEQVPNSAIHDSRGPDIENSRDEWLVFEKIDWAHGHLILEAHSEPVRRDKARQKTGAQDIVLRNETYGVVVKNGPGQGSQVVNERVTDERSTEPEVFLE